MGSKNQQFHSSNDYNKHEALNFVLEKVWSKPMTNVGQARVLFDLTLGMMFVFNGEEWIACQGAPYKFQGAVSCTSDYKVDLSQATKDYINNKITANAPINPGTKCKVTFDENGLVLGGGNLGIDDIPDLSGRYIHVNKMGQPNGVATLDSSGNIVQSISIPDASTSVKGILYLASVAEVEAGTDTDKAVTPYTLNELITPITTAIGNMTSDITDLGNNKADKAEAITTTASSGNITLTTNTIYKTVATGDINYILPTPNNAVYNQILVHLDMSSGAVIVDTGISDANHFLNSAINLTSAGRYDLIYEYDPSEQEWYCGVVKKGI